MLKPTCIIKNYISLIVITALAACGGGGGGGGSSTVPPVAPGVTAIADSLTQITVSWVAITGASSYDVYRSTTANQDLSAMTKLTAIPLTATYLTDTGLAANTTYYYKVVALDSVGIGTALTEVSTTTPIPPGTNPPPVFYSAPGGQANNWQWRNPVPTGEMLSGVAQGTVGTGTIYVAVGGSGTILTSPDGITWAAQTSGSTYGLSAVTWNGTLFVAVGGSGTILTSPDGITWTPRSSGTTNPLNALSAIAWSGTQFVVVGTGMRLTSPDGITWTINSGGVGFSVTWGGGQFVAVGPNGAIHTITRWHHVDISHFRHDKLYLGCYMEWHTVRDSRA